MSIKKIFLIVDNEQSQLLRTHLPSYNRLETDHHVIINNPHNYDPDFMEYADIVIVEITKLTDNSNISNILYLLGIANSTKKKVICLCPSKYFENFVRFKEHNKNFHLVLSSWENLHKVWWRLLDQYEEFPIQIEFEGQISKEIHTITCFPLDRKNEKQIYIILDGDANLFWYICFDEKSLTTFNMVFDAMERSNFKLVWKFGCEKGLQLIFDDEKINESLTKGFLDMAPT